MYRESYRLSKDLYGMWRDVFRESVFFSSSNMILMLTFKTNVTQKSEMDSLHLVQNVKL